MSFNHSAADIVDEVEEALNVSIVGMSDRNAGEMTGWVLIYGVASKATVATVVPVKIQFHNA